MKNYNFLEPKKISKEYLWLFQIGEKIGIPDTNIDITHAAEGIVESVGWLAGLFGRKKRSVPRPYPANISHVIHEPTAKN